MRPRANVLGLGFAGPGTRISRDSGLRQPPRLLLDLADGLGDLVHVGPGAEEAVWKSQTPCSQSRSFAGQWVRSR